MELVQIRTVDQLRDFMQSAVTDFGEPIEDKDLIWFVCMQEAEALLDSCSTKDIASMFLSGIPAINSLADVQAHIDTRFEDGEEYHEDNNKYLVAAVYRFLGQYDKANEVVSDDEDE